MTTRRFRKDGAGSYWGITLLFALVTGIGNTGGTAMAAEALGGVTSSLSLYDVSLSNSQSGSATVISSSGVTSTDPSVNRGVIINSNPNNDTTDEYFSVYDGGQEVFRAVGDVSTVMSNGSSSITVNHNGTVAIDTTGGLSVSGGALNMNNNNLTNVGAISGLASISTSGDASVGGNLDVDGATTTDGITNDGNITTDTLTTNGAATLNSASVTNDMTVGGTLTTGALVTDSFTNNGAFATTTFTTTGAATLNSAAVTNDLAVGGNLDIDGATTTDGITNDGDITTDTLHTNGAATLNSATVTNDLTVGGTLQVAGATALNDNLTVHGTVNSITGTTSSTMTGGNASVVLAGQTAGMGVDGGGSVTAYGSAQTYSTGSEEVSYLNRINGDTLVDGDMYVTGTLDYSSSTSFNTSVGDGDSILGDNGTTHGQISVVNKDQDASHAVVDDNGKITLSTDAADESVASLTLTNGYGNVHGIVVTEQQLTLSGGTGSTTMTLDDNGAAFRDAETGGPVKVTGVADGDSRYDAVNYHQFKGLESKMSSGIAMAAGLAAIPQVDQYKTYCLGVGTGFYNGEASLAVGGSIRLAQNAVFKGGIGFSSSEREPVGNAGVAFSW